MSFDFVPLPEDVEIFDKLYEYKAAPYGGYLRDTIAGDIPKDIDVVVSEHYSKDFFDDPIIKAYKKTFNPDNHTYILTQKGKRDLEVYLVSDHPDTTMIGPEAAPDFDVNLLVCHNGMLSNWTGCDSEQRMNPEVKEIIASIEKKEACWLNRKVHPSRTEKIKARGYKIIGPYKVMYE